MDSATSSSSPDPAPRRAHSMRFRVAVSLAALALLVIVVQSIVMFRLLDRKEEEFIDQQLSEQIEHSMALWQKSPDAAFPNTPSMWLYRVGKGEAGQGVPPFLARLPVGNHETYLGSKEYHVAVREDDKARYILAYDVEDHESRLDSLIAINLTAAIGLALFTLLAGYLVAGRLTRQLESLAGRLDASESQSLVEPGMSDELLAVASTLERYRLRQAAAIERERAFAANLSHELRTPLTGIRTDAELMAGLPAMPALAQRRAQRIIASVDRITRLSSSLLLLAREGTPQATETVALRALLESLWQELTVELTPAPPLVLAVPEAVAVQADPALLALVLRNLLDNALRYSGTGPVHCLFVDTRLIVRDAGPGFTDADLGRVFDRFYVGERGMHGLGLALVRHACEASGWQVSAANAVEGGGELTVDFGAACLAPT